MLGGAFPADSLAPVVVLAAAMFAAAVGAARVPAQIVGRARVVLLALALFSALAVGQIIGTEPLGFRLRVDPSTEPLLPRGDPSRAAYERAVLDFGDDEIYAIAIECEEVFSVACLSAVERLSIGIAHLPGVRSISSLMDVTSFRWVPEKEWIEIRPFMDAVPTSEDALAERRARALIDPVYRQVLVSTDARTAAVNVGFRKQGDAALIESGVDERVAALLASEARAGFVSHVAGRPHVKVNVYRGILHDLSRLIPLAIGVMACVLGLFMRSVRGALLPLGAAFAANLWTFGVLGAHGGALTLLTGLLAPMLLAVGCVYGVHVVSRYEEEVESATSARAAAQACLEHIRLPALIAGLTTGIGFAALLVSDVPAVNEFGVYSMLGIASATLISVTGIPAALALLPLRAGRAVKAGRVGEAGGAQPRGAGRLDRLLAALAARVARHGSAVILSFCALGAVSAALIPRIEIDTDYLSYFTPDDPVRVEFEAVNRLLSGAVPLYVVIDGGAPGALREPALLERIAALQADIDALPGVSRTLSLVDPLRQLNRAFHADDPAYARIPATRQATSELLFMLPKSDSSRFITIDHARANVIVRTGEVGSAAILALTARIEAVIARHALPAPVRADVVGNTLLLSRSADGIARSQPLGVGLASASIFLLISAALGSPFVGAIAMLPNVIPLLMFFGLLGAGAAPLSLPTSLIGSMALGIAIDDTVHFIVRYRRERERGAAPEQAAARSGRRVGRPIAVTSVMLCAGFLVLTASRFASLQEFGVLCAATMAICLVTDLVLLPAVLIRTRG